MADLDNDTDEDPGVNTDYYAVLNVRKEANEDELKAAYKRMCVLYHPDKHQDPSKKKIAVELFSKIQKAYEVLGNPETRVIYDVYGQKGLEAGWEIIERQRTPAEIRQEYERLQREKEEQRLEQITNPSSRLSVGVDATDLFDRSEDLSSERVLPNIEVSSMSISQSIEAPITQTDAVMLAGSLDLQNGQGSGNVSITARRTISYRAWGEVELSAGDGPTLTFRAFRNIFKKNFATAGLSIKYDEEVVSLADFTTMIARHLDKHTVGSLTWSVGVQSFMKTTVIRETGHNRFALTLQLGFPNTFAVVSCTKELDKETKVKASFKSGTFGTIVEYACERQISKYSKLGGMLSIGLPVGVLLNIRLTRASQVYNFPINLSSEINSAAIFYGTVAPVAIFLIVKVLIIKPFLAKEKEKEAEAKKERYAKKVAEKRRDAENSIRLMQDTCQRSLGFETSRHGLIIVNAWYGHLVSMEEAVQAANRGASKVIDVTVPVQCQVKDSRLFLTEASKSDLSGFYDPCPEEEKMLRIKYLFRESLHEVTVGDKEAVRIPKQSHRIIPS